jgi:protein-S-isoprenylcysteine O-methyltransferase Ste14
LPPAPALLAGLPILSGAGLIVAAESVFLMRGGSSGAPADPARFLGTTGMYRRVRNPIYLGGALVLLGVSLAGRSPSLLLAACLYLPILHATVVRGEERRMERDFGDDYLEYRRRVPRWIPRPPR